MKTNSACTTSRLVLRNSPEVTKLINELVTEDNFELHVVENDGCGQFVQSHGAAQDADVFHIITSELIIIGYIM